jgi:CHC2 zinc finger
MIPRSTVIRCKCPFHDDKINTLFVYSFPNCTTFHCFGCGEHGSATKRSDGSFWLPAHEITLQAETQ